jgi:hypothetical protein
MMKGLAMNPTHLDVPLPWWRVGAAWFGVLALGAVVLGSFALLFTAVQHRDTVVNDPVAAAHGVPNKPTSPALQARNHSATPP